MDLKLLCDAAGLSCPVEQEALEITSIAVDSREVTKGSLFLCIKGFHRDAHECIPEAIKAGATCILVQEGADVPWGEIPPEITVIKVKDPRRASAYLYDAWYGFPSKHLKIIGVTGTNGKTSVTHILQHVLESALCKCGVIGTVGCESLGRRLDVGAMDPLANMTTPDPRELYRVLAEMRKDGVEYVLMEVTSHALALQKTAPIHFRAALFTNLTPEHLDFHKTMDAYAEAKARLFEQSELSVILMDSPYAKTMLSHARGRAVTCSATDALCDYCATERSVLGQSGVSYRLLYPSGSVALRCAIPGSFTVPNSMLAAVCALELGLGVGRIQDALRSIPGVKGRMEKLRLGIDADFTVMIDYAHTPDAMENLLRSVNALKKHGERTVLLFGCGGDRDREKRALMGKIATTHADAVIVTSDNSRGEDPEDIIAQILQGVEKNAVCTVIQKRDDAIRYAIETARTGDWILLAGKGHEEYEIDREGRKPFSEREIVLEAFEHVRIRRRMQNDGLSEI